ALQLAEQAALIIAARALTDPVLRFNVFNLLGIARCGVGELTAADEAFDTALEALRGTDRYPRRLAAGAMNKGVAAAYRGDSVAPLRCFNECLSVEEARVGVDDPSLAGLLANISGQYAEVGEFDEAVRVARRALNLFAEEPTRSYAYLAALTNLGEALLKQ